MKLSDFLRNLFTKNLGLKLASLILAFAFWITFVNLADPVSTDTYQIPLGVENFDEYMAGGRYVELADGGSLSGKNLAVTLRARLSVLKALRDSKSIESVVSAYVDVFEAENGILKIHYAVDPGYADSIDLSSLSNASYLPVRMEQMSSAVLFISPEINGTPAPGYRILENDPDFFLTKNSVTLYGPPSKLAEYASVTASISVSKASASLTANRPLRFFDEDGRELIPDGKVVTTDVREVGMHVPVYRIKKLAVTVSLTGRPPEGYVYLNDLSLTRESIEVFALSDVLSGVDTLELAPISLSSVTGEYSRRYLLSTLVEEILGPSVRLNENDGEMTIRLHTEPLVSRNVELSLSQLIINNLPSGWHCDVLTEEVQLVLGGLNSEIDAALRGLKLSVSLPEELREGELELELTVEGLPDSVTLEQGARVTLSLKPAA